MGRLFLDFGRIDQFHSFIKKIILPIYKYNAIIFVMFCSKNVGCLLGVACYVLWCFGLTVFHSEFILICQDGIKNKELDVLRACKISERSGIWKRMPGIILLPGLNEQSV